MGKSSRSSRDYSPKRRDKDRDRHRDRYGSSSSSKKDNSSEISKMKEKMRSGIEEARKYQSSSDTTYKKEDRESKQEEYSVAEQLARAKAIESIEESGFQPANFRSSQGGAGGRVYGHTEAKKEVAEKSHDSAIFGPAWKSTEHMKRIEKKESDLSSVKLPDGPARQIPITNAPMIPSHMLSENTETRKQLWFDYWKIKRQELLSQ